MIKKLRSVLSHDENCRLLSGGATHYETDQNAREKCGERKNQESFHNGLLLIRQTVPKLSTKASIERGVENPTLYTIEAVAEGLGVTVGELIKGL